MAAPDTVSTSEIGRATSTNYSARRRRQVPIFWYAPASTGWQETARNYFPMQMKQPGAGPPPPRRCGTSKANCRMPYWKFAIAHGTRAPPIGKQKKYPELILTAIHAQERDTPQVARRSTGNCLPICPCARVRRLPRNSIGTRRDGRSRPSTKSSNPAAEPKKRTENRRAACESHRHPLF